MAKAPNYSVEDTDFLSRYSALDNDPDRIAFVGEAARTLNRKPASIIAKLSHMGIYVKPEKKDKAGRKVETKAEVCDAIADLVPGLTDETAATLTGGNKSALRAVRDRLAELTAEVEGDEAASG